MARVSVRCPRCAVPIELPAQQVAPGRYVLSVEPLFDHVAEQHGPSVITLHELVDLQPDGAVDDELGQQTTGVVEQRELPKSRTSTDIT